MKHDIIKCNKISLELTQHNGQVAFFIAIEPSLTSTSSSRLIFGYISVENTITYDLIKTLVKYDMFSFLETFVHETFIPKKDLWSKIVRQSISISEENRWLENIIARIDATYWTGCLLYSHRAQFDQHE
jgi:hypothetical protein